MTKFYVKVDGQRIPRPYSSSGAAQREVDRMMYSEDGKGFFRYEVEQCNDDGEPCVPDCNSGSSLDIVGTLRMLIILIIIGFIMNQCNGG